MILENILLSIFKLNLIKKNNLNVFDTQFPIIGDNPYKLPTNLCAAGLHSGYLSEDGFIYYFDLSYIKKISLL